MNQSEEEPALSPSQSVTLTFYSEGGLSFKETKAQTHCPLLTHIQARSLSNQLYALFSTLICPVMKDAGWTVSVVFSLKRLPQSLHSRQVLVGKTIFMSVFCFENKTMLCTGIFRIRISYCATIIGRKCCSVKFCGYVFLLPVLFYPLMDWNASDFPDPIPSRSLGH